MRTSRGIVVAVVLAACAPTVEGPVERQRAADREDGDRLALQLAQLPGAVSAQVTLHRAARDPLGVAPASPASAAALIIVDDQANRAAITQSATTLVRAAAPEITAPAILVEVGVVRPTLAKVGPFTVEAASKAKLKAVLAIALALIAGLAGWIAITSRRSA